MKNKVLIVTLRLGHNYGGILQAYALQRTLISLGYDCVTTGSSGSLIRKNLRKIPLVDHAIRRIRKTTSLSNASISSLTTKFIKENISLISFEKALNFSFKGQFQAVISGSDQVWRKKFAYLPHTYLCFPARGARKFSYAASFGTDNISEYNQFDRLIAGHQLRSFDGISVRENSGATILERHWGIGAHVHIDPTLLLTREDYVPFVSKEENKSPYIFSYCLDPSPVKQILEGEIAKELTLEVRSLIKDHANSGQPLPPVEDWISSFYYADFVITDSFHGMVFSIIFQKPFIVMGNAKRGMARFQSLLQLLGLSNRLIDERVADPASNVKNVVRSNIEWDKVSQIVESQRKDAISFLKKTLK